MSKRFKSGFINPKYCTCKNYKPRSTRGLIVLKCKHCNKHRKPRVYG